MISVIIPFFNQNSFRLRNLRAVIKNYSQNFDYFNLYVIEQGKENTEEVKEICELYNVSLHYIDLDNELFYKTKLLNTAINDIIKDDIIMMSDADCIMPYIDYQNIIDNLENHSILFPFSRVNYLNEGHTRVYVNSGKLFSSFNQPLFINRYTGLINIFTRETFDKVGGFDESFIGWGCEDDAFVNKCKRIVNPIKRLLDFNIEILHLYHPNVNTNEYLNTECFTWNKKTLATICRMDDNNLVEYIKHSKNGNIGFINDIVNEFDTMGKLTYLAKISIGSGNITLDTTIYDAIPVNGELGLDDVLRCVFDVDGRDCLNYVITSIYETIHDISDYDKKILEKYSELL